MNLLGSIAQGAYWANQVQGDQLAQQSQSINNQLGLQQLAQGKMQLDQQQQEQQSAQTAQQSLQQLLQQKDQTPLKMAQGIDQIANSVSINDPKLADSLRKESKGYRDQAQAQAEQTNQQISDSIDGAKSGDPQAAATLANLVGRPVPKNKAELDTLTNTAESRVMGYQAHAQLQEKAQDAKDKLQETARHDKEMEQERRDSIANARIAQEGNLLLKQSAAEAKKEAAEEKKSKGTAQSQRQQLVVASSTNALNRLDEIEKNYGAPTVSLLQGLHPEGMIGAAGMAIGRAFQSEQQQKIDADYSALIDEAIPSLTGGLRGSDAYRKFLLQQLPQPGNSEEAAKEKLRVFKENISGVRNTFMNKFMSDETLQATEDKAKIAKGEYVQKNAQPSTADDYLKSIGVH